MKEGGEVRAGCAVARTANALTPEALRLLTKGAGERPRSVVWLVVNCTVVLLLLLVTVNLLLCLICKLDLTAGACKSPLLGLVPSRVSGAPWGPWIVGLYLLGTQSRLQGWRRAGGGGCGGKGGTWGRDGDRS